VVNNVVEAIKNGFEVTIITNKKKDFLKSSQQQLLNNYNISNLIREYKEPKGKKIRVLKAMVLLLNPVLFFYYLRYGYFKKQKTLRHLFCLKFYYPFTKATFHVHFANALEPLLELKKIGFLKSKIIVTFHGFDAHFLPTGKHLENLVNDYKMYVEHITVNSVYLKQILVDKSFPVSKIKIIPVGLDIDVFKPTKAVKEVKSPLQLITIARLVDLKGVDYGIQVVKKLIDKGQDVNYTIVGEGPEEKRLKVLCSELGIEKNVRFLGKKSQPEIKNLLEDHHLFLMTSTIDKNGRREAFGVVSLEAQAMELPVIGFKSGGFPETILDGKTGILVDDKDVEAMAAAVETLIHDKELLLKMGKQARVHVLENFSFEKTTKKYLDLYQ